MGMRGLGAMLVLALLGLAAGWGIEGVTRADPATFRAPAPVVAVDPSWPAEPVPVLPDPAFPALPTGLRTHPETVGLAPFALRVPIPKGWVRTNPTAAEWRWYPTGRLETNVYFLRVRLVANRYQSIPSAVDERRRALQDAEGVADLQLDSVTTDGFTATYVADGYRRVSMERFIGANGGTTAYASVALIGRESDRVGMADLFPRIVEGAHP